MLDSKTVLVGRRSEKSGRIFPCRVGFCRVGSDPAGSGRILPGRVGSCRVGSDPTGSGRILTRLSQILNLGQILARFLFCDYFGVFEIFMRFPGVFL